MSGGFADHFSANAASYGRFRPVYPEPLFDHLAALAPRRELAWDCATGSGQAVAPLARRFRLVVASDASAAQIAHAQSGDNVRLLVASAERVPLAAASIDLITVAQALHWFALPAFFAEVARVLRPRGVLAVWTYNLFSIEPRIDALVRAFYIDTVGPYWPPQRRLVDDAYAGIELPFAETATTTWTVALRWNLAHLLAYIATWSAVAQYRRARGADPMPGLASALAAAWGESPEREIVWPLTVKTARASA